MGLYPWPWLCAAAESGFSVVGIDVDAPKVDAINRGQSYVKDIAAARLQAVMVERSRLQIDYIALL